MEESEKYLLIEDLSITAEKKFDYSAAQAVRRRFDYIWDLDLSAPPSLGEKWAQTLGVDRSFINLKECSGVDVRLSAQVVKYIPEITESPLTLALPPEIETIRISMQCNDHLWVGLWGVEGLRDQLITQQEWRQGRYPLISEWNHIPLSVKVYQALTEIINATTSIADQPPNLN